METWTKVFGKIWGYADIHFSPTICAVGVLYDNRRKTTGSDFGRGLQILLGPLVIRVYLEGKPPWVRWKDMRREGAK